MLRGSIPPRGAAISLPQGMAYALIAGVDPRFGLYSAIVVTLAASLLGSSSHLVNGPTSTISLVVFSALAFLDPNCLLAAAGDGAAPDRCNEEQASSVPCVN